MANIAGIAGRRWSLPGISEIFAYLARRASRRERPVRLDPALLPEERLRDIGLLDGRGLSRRRPHYGRDGRIDGF